jgi:hypothetical protein
MTIQNQRDAHLAEHQREGGTHEVTNEKRFPERQTTTYTRYRFERRRITMLKRLLFETRLGEWLLASLERWAGLAVVDANWLGHQRPTAPAQPSTQ